MATDREKLRWCPETGAGAEKLVHSPAAYWRCSTAAFSFLFILQSGGKRIDS
ncbi:MAG: hypothetical protein QM296_09150 [Bacillota bacterium]|nr:hypothetical protein [Bacillota bacterium]